MLSQSITGKKRSFILCVVAVLVFCLYSTGLQWNDFLPKENGFSILKKFGSAALHPATNYQSTDLPTSAPPYYMKVLKSLWLTLQYATCAISLALVGGILLGFLGSRSWWPDTGKSPIYRTLLLIIHRLTRTLITFGRSIHELLWALLLLSALGTAPFTAIMALTIPYGCTLAKVFSEIIDEQDQSNSLCLQAHGSSSLSTWLFGIIPNALPDLISYALYRYECAIRSAAILGFVGITTIGYHIETAFADGHYNEIWTLLYSLLALLIIIENISYFIRRKITTPLKMKSAPVKATAAMLKKSSPKKISLYVLAGLASLLVFLSWNTGEPMFSTISPEQRSKNLTRFIDKEITPYPVQQSGDWSDAIPWAKELFVEKGFDAALQTLYIATSAICIAFLLGLLTVSFGAKSFNQSSLDGSTLGSSKIMIWLRKITSLIVRFIFMITRSLPEFLLAYLLLQILGSTAWPLILGLALHNYGIIGRLSGELIDHSINSNSRTLLAHGATRNQIYVFSALPELFNRLLLYFFYRWETCIRDATILGMLGIASLGFLIDDASARDSYDELLFYTLLGACIVMLGDIFSDIVRSRIKKT